MARDKRDWVISKVLAKQAQTIGDRPLVQWQDGDAITYAEAHAAANRVGNSLIALSVGIGERVGLMLPNSLEFLWSWLGILRVGGVAVTINTAYRGVFLEQVLSNSGAERLIIHPDYLEWLAEIEDQVPRVTTAIVPGWRGRGPSFQRINVIPFEPLMDGPDRDINIDVTYRDIGTIMYTSGTTGPSKGVLMSHGHMYLLGLSGKTHLRVTEQDVCYQCMQLFHAMGMFLQLVNTMMAGARAVMVPSFSATNWIDDIRKYRITFTSTLGVMSEFIMRQPRQANEGDNDLRVVLAIPLTDDIVDQYRERFGVTKVIEGFGMTECGMPLWFPYDEPLRVGSCGLAWHDYYDVRIVDPETDEEVPKGEIGEIVVRPREAYCLMQGYNNAHEKTVETWRNFWFHSGDAGRQDEDGYFWYVDRIKDAIRRRGENISSYEVEYVLTEHPAIEEAAAVAVPSDIPGGEDEVLACLVLAVDCEPPSPEALLEFCIARMPYFAVPRFIEFVDVLPKTPSQKVQKAKLRDLNRDHAIWDRESVGLAVTRRGLVRTSS
ncbi:MAG: AMP-binding protein [Pseudomonadota bacterium]